jgi:hypothetical protein
MFKQNTSNNKDELNSSSSRPKTRRGLDDTFHKDNEQGTISHNDIWRPSSEVEEKDPVDPLIGLDDIQNQTARSNEQKNSLTNSNNTDNVFKDWYPKDDEN